MAKKAQTIQSGILTSQIRLEAPKEDLFVKDEEKFREKLEAGCKMYKSYSSRGPRTMAEGALAHLISLVESPREEDAIAATRYVIPGNSLQPYHHFLQKAGFREGDQTLTSATEAIQKDGAQIWLAIANRAASGAADEGRILTPLLDKVLDFAEMLRERTRDLSGTGVKKPLESVPLGGALDEAEARLAEWVKTASAKELTQATGLAGAYLKRIAATHSHLLADEDGSATLVALIDGYLLEALENPNLNAATLEIVADAAIKQVDGTDAASIGSKELGKREEFWRTMAKKELHLTKRQIRQLRTVAITAHNQNSRLGARNTLENIAGIRDALQDETTRQIMEQAVREHGTSLEICLLHSTPGPQWGERVGKIMRAIDSGVGDKYGFIRALKHTDEWNLAGVRPEALLCLVGADEEELRQIGRDTTVRLTQEPARQIQRSAKPGRSGARAVS